MQEEKNKNLSRNGIAHDLSLSPYYVDVNYYGYKLTYVFSSKLNMYKFCERLEDYSFRSNKGIISQYKVDFGLNLDVLWGIKLYERIEKRGFMVIKDDEVKLCKDTLKLDGLIVMLKN